MHQWQNTTQNEKQTKRIIWNFSWILAWLKPGYSPAGITERLDKQSSVVITSLVVNGYHVKLHLPTCVANMECVTNAFPSDSYKCSRLAFCDNVSQPHGQVENERVSTTASWFCPVCTEYLGNAVYACSLVASCKAYRGCNHCLHRVSNGHNSRDYQTPSSIDLNQLPLLMLCYLACPSCPDPVLK